MTESEGCDLLRSRFEAAGLHIERDYPFDEEGVVFSMDGYDAARRVGFEYVTTEAGDRDEVTQGVIAALDERAARGDLFVLIVDERDAPDAMSLNQVAEGFLEELFRRGVLK